MSPSAMRLTIGVLILSVFVLLCAAVIYGGQP